MAKRSPEPFLRQAQQPSPAAQMIAWVLYGGVLSSVCLIIVGMLVTFARHPTYFSDRTELAHLVRPGNAVPNTLTAVVKGIQSGRGQAIVVAGLIVLMLTPVTRVAISTLIFVEEGDWIFMAITLFVLGMLILSFLLGKAAA